MSTARMKQISSEVVAVAASESSSELRTLAATEVSIGEDNNGVAAAEIAAPVPNFRASRRVILLIGFSRP